MRMSRITFAALLGICVTTVGWTQAQPPKGKRTPPSEAVKLTARASNDFACDLFRDLAKDKAGKNVFLSPWSIASALAMTMEGARNDTAAEMGQVLRLPADLRQGGDRPWQLVSYHEGFADLQRRCTPPRDLAKDATTRARIVELRKDLAEVNRHLLRRDTAEFRKKAEDLAATINKLQQQLAPFELNVANAIWGEKTYPFDPNYTEAVGRHYGAGLVREADFINGFPAERLKINRWVEDQTKDKIKDLIPKIPPDEARLIRMILVNAIYFKGQWSEPFKKEWTKDEPFRLADGTNARTALMRQTLSGRYAAFNADGSYFETPRLIERGGKEKTYPGPDGFLIAEVPYKGNKVAMTVIAPHNPSGLPALEKKLNGETLTRWLSRLEARDVQVWLPKFKMDTDYELGKPLDELGMKKAFKERKADFSGMSKSSDANDKLHISRVIHKAFVDVNEEGTEAAAATAVIVEVPSGEPTVFPFTPEFRADRPFLFLIREVETGAILFMGRVTAPSS